MFCSEPLCEADMKAAKETSEEKKSEAPRASDLLSVQNVGSADW